ncbi:hypothetical protein KZZ52_00130 [Dactylosporangium sp. AC04546]|uniref:hypothetical protein n=1 Tax=Dactylosporangium sp. AC04546 TaxID=2862460 RepID=UPI002E7B8652|nr:hypothetical protein [Dactylosporangium sp. AC04546]WVK83904.1 hypothetical protein KZZ52_00130 [Dactylosporangium sp. AC04546]
MAAGNGFGGSGLSWGMKRRELLGLGGVVLLASCSSDSPAPVAAPGELLAVSMPEGTVVLDSGTARKVAAGALLAGNRLVGFDPDGRVVVRNAADGSVVTAASVRGNLRIAAAAPGAGLLALVEGAAGGRSQTTIVVAGPTGERHRLTLPGFVEPEAFSSSGTELFVLDMLPPEHPDRYRVRVLDLAGGQLRALNLPGENAGVKVLVPPGAEEEMRGEGRQAVFDARRERLFTLYSHQPDHEHVRDLLNPGARDGKPDVHAFVHTLSVKDGWAVCVDLPSSFGTGEVPGLTIAQSADEVWVVDAGKGLAAVIHADALAVTHEIAVPAVAGAAASAAGGGRLYLAAGRKVTVLDVGAKEVASSWALPADALGIAVSSGHLYVGQPEAVLRLDPLTGATTGRVAIPGLKGLHGVVG